MVSNATAGLTCPSPMKPTSNGIFQGDDPLQFSLPLAILQICLVVVVTRSLAFILKPLRRPRVIAEIISMYGQASTMSVAQSTQERSVPISNGHAKS